MGQVADGQLVLVVDCRLGQVADGLSDQVVGFLLGQVADARSMLAAHGNNSDGMAATDQSNRTRGSSSPILPDVVHSMAGKA